MAYPCIKANLRKGVNRIGQQMQFGSIVDAFDFASDVLNGNSSERNPVFFEWKLSKVAVILQCQNPGYFLQAFRQELSDEGWLTVVEKKEELALETEIVIPFYEDNEGREEVDYVAKTHFRLLGIEGAWVSKALLCNRDLVGQGLFDIGEYVSGAPWNNAEYWIDVGLM